MRNFLNPELSKMKITINNTKRSLKYSKTIQNVLCWKNTQLGKIGDKIKEVIGKAKSTEINLPERLVLYGIETFNQKQIAKRSNKFFAEIGPKLCVLNSKFF